MLYEVITTPLIVTVAAVTWMVSGDADRAIAVLVVGCPCSFLLSGPVPAVAAIGRARITSYNVCYTKLLRPQTWMMRI